MGDELDGLLDRVIAAKGASLRRWRTVTADAPGCFSVPRLERGERTGDWTDDERRHLGACVACQRTRTLLRITAASGNVTDSPVEADEPLRTGG
jgi:hypothetical protein